MPEKDDSRLRALIASHSSNKEDQLQQIAAVLICPETQKQINAPGMHWNDGTIATNTQQIHPIVTTARQFLYREITAESAANEFAKYSPAFRTLIKETEGKTPLVDITTQLNAFINLAKRKDSPSLG